MNASDYEITDGYVGSFGKTFKTATDATLTEAIRLEEIRNETTEESISRQLEAGLSVTWCDSPNYHYDHSHGTIRRKKAAPVSIGKLCDCGHYSHHPMTTSTGSSCPDCYDDMSE
jgi:hypothetical protein